MYQENHLLGRRLDCQAPILHFFSSFLFVSPYFESANGDFVGCVLRKALDDKVLLKTLCKLSFFDNTISVGLKPIQWFCERCNWCGCRRERSCIKTGKVFTEYFFHKPALFSKVLLKTLCKLSFFDNTISVGLKPIQWFCERCNWCGCRRERSCIKTGKVFTEYFFHKPALFSKVLLLT